MATIRPFVSQRFSPEAGCLADLVAPPYDVLSPQQRDALAAKSEHNTVWLTLPEALSDDRSKYVKYGRSASRLSGWRREGVLVPEEKPAFYRYRQTFTDPVTGVKRGRNAVICLIKIEPYEESVILPHEKTFPKHKEDRLRLLEATRTHLECIYGLYEDSTGQVSASIDSARFDTIADTTGADGVRHELSRCMDAAANAALSEAFEPERVWIADGHHRYETAMGFRQSLGPKDGLVAEDFLMIALSGMQDPGLVLLPTHRLVNGWDVEKNMADQKLQTLFNERSLPNSELPCEVRRLADKNVRVFGVALPGGAGILATLEDPADAANLVDLEGSDLLKSLDVTILHEVILGRLFDIEGTDRIEYTRDANEAVKRVAEADDVAAFLMNPPSVDDMRRIALGGEKMPQKSTYYYPKLLSGLVFWSLDDFK